MGRAPSAGVHYPRSLGEFSAWFSTDADCRDYLEWLRWPTGLCASGAGIRRAGGVLIGG